MVQLEKLLMDLGERMESLTLVPDIASAQISQQLQVACCPCCICGLSVVMYCTAACRQAFAVSHTCPILQ